VLTSRGKTSVVARPVYLHAPRSVRPTTPTEKRADEINQTSMRNNGVVAPACKRRPIVIAPRAPVSAPVISSRRRACRRNAHRYRRTRPSCPSRDRCEEREQARSQRDRVSTRIVAARADAPAPTRTNHTVVPFQTSRPRMIWSTAIHQHAADDPHATASRDPRPFEREVTMRRKYAGNSVMRNSR